MEFHSRTMNYGFNSKEDYVQFVADLLRTHPEPLTLTTTIEQGKSVASFAATATIVWLEDTGTPNSSGEQQTT